MVVASYPQMCMVCLAMCLAAKRHALFLRRHEDATIDRRQAPTPPGLDPEFVRAHPTMWLARIDGY
jgi:hypothetical protein